MKLEIKKIGNSTGLILPKELLSRFNLAQGDWVYVTAGANGEITLKQGPDPEFERGMEIAKKAMATYRNALAELAK